MTGYARAAHDYPGHRFTATRSQLVDAIARCQPAAITAVSGVVKISAESMADAIMEALRDGPALPDEVVVYPANEMAYGFCLACRTARWLTERSRAGSHGTERSRHCGCCTHPHDLEDGAHVLTEGTQS
jgi:hypothetical protein